MYITRIYSSISIELCICIDTDLYPNLMVGHMTHTCARVCVAFASHARAQCGANTRARQVRVRVSVHLCAYRHTHTHAHFLSPKGKNALAHPGAYNIHIVKYR